MGLGNFHSTRIRPWALVYLFPAGVALHITIRLFNEVVIMEGKKFVLILLLFCLFGIIGLIALMYGFLWLMFNG
ncbi:hypothetical protein PPE_05555 [Paenibacillus polymyxa E681]|nr:hypothetical protein PPE_05555 [Paenibacillus polymyxa E681]